MDRESVKRGRSMLAATRSLIVEVMGSKAMTDMHSREAVKLPAMTYTHKVTSDVLEVLDLLHGLPERK